MSAWKNLVFRVFVSGIASFVVSFSLLLVIPPPALAANDQNFFEKVIEWIFTPGGKQEEVVETPTPPTGETPSSSGPDTELSVPTKIKEVVKYILELPDNIVTSRNIMGETVTTRNLSKPFSFLMSIFLISHQ